MKAQNDILTNIINTSTLIEVPFFQRNYVWKEDLWQRLLDDMEFLIKTKRPHFMGSIILKEGRDPAETDNFITCKTVVDGQQRLTTFLIFLKALCIKKKELSLFDSHFRLLDGTIALLHGKNDVDAFFKVMNKTDEELLDNQKDDSKIINAFNFYITNIDPKKLEIVPILNKTQFVKIDLDKNEDEQQIFDSINSLGVTLTTSELLKNYFFNRDTINEYNEYWEDVFEKDDETKAYWDLEIETGRLKRTLIDVFFDAYFQMFIQNRKYNINNEDKLAYSRVDQLSKSYQHFINRYCNGDKGVVLKNLKKYALSFKDLFNPDWCNKAVPSNFGIERINILIFGIQNTTLIPYILYLDNEINDKNIKNNIYAFLENFIMRRIITRSETKNYNNLFTSLILNEVKDLNSLKARFNTVQGNSYIPSDTEMLDGFNNSKLINQQSKAVIYLIESSIRPENSSVALLGFNKYSLEHIMPKKWRNNWQHCATDELDSQRDHLLLTLGNLAIITQSLNSSIRDASWPNKKKGKKNKPGLSLCASGLTTLHDALNKQEWNETEIHDRSRWLYDHAKKIWKV